MKMKVLSITSNSKRSGTLASLCEEAARGATDGGAEVEEIRLAERDIRYCRFCMSCFKDRESPLGKCSQDDDLASILEKAREADGFILSSPLSSAQANALFKTFFERCCYTAGRPVKFLGFLDGLPVTRLTDKQRYSVTVVTAGGMPAWLRPLCNGATSQMVEMSKRSFNAKVVGRLFAGNVRKRGLHRKDRKKAYEIGRSLAENIRYQGKPPAK